MGKQSNRKFKYLDCKIYLDKLSKNTENEYEKSEKTGRILTPWGESAPKPPGTYKYWYKKTHLYQYLYSKPTKSHWTMKPVAF